MNQNSCLELSVRSTIWFTSANAGADTLPFTSGASSVRQTSSSSRKPSTPKANSRNGTSEERIWKEIALAYVSRSFST